MRRTHPFWGIMWYNQLYTFKNVLLHVVTYTSPTGRFIIGWNVLPHQRTQQNYAYLDKSMILNECLIQQLKSRHVGLVTRTKTILPVTLRWGGYAVNNQKIWYINAVIHECESSIFRWKHMYYTCTHNMYVYYIYIYIYIYILYMQYRHTVLHSWLANHLESIPLINTDQGWSVGHFEHFIDWACSVEHGSTRVQVWVNLSCRVLQLISGPLNEDTW